MELKALKASAELHNQQYETNPVWHVLHAASNPAQCPTQVYKRPGVDIAIASYIINREKLRMALTSLIQMGRMSGCLPSRISQNAKGINTVESSVIMSVMVEI